MTLHALPKGTFDLLLGGLWTGENEVCKQTPSGLLNIDCKLMLIHGDPKYRSDLMKKQLSEIESYSRPTRGDTGLSYGSFLTLGSSGRMDVELERLLTKESETLEVTIHKHINKEVGMIAWADAGGLPCVPGQLGIHGEFETTLG